MKKIKKKIFSGLLAASLVFGSMGGSGAALAETAETSGQQVNVLEVPELQAEASGAELPTDDLETIKVILPAFAEQIRMQSIPVYDGENVQNSLSTLDPVIRGGIGSYGRSKLSEKQQEMYDGLEVACITFLNSNKDITTDKDAYTGSVALNGLTLEQASQAFVAFYYDHPVYCWIGGYASLGTAICVAVKEDYYTDASRDAVEEWIKSGVAEYKTETDQYTDTWEKVRAIHDKMILDVEYAYKSGTTPESAAWAHNVEGAFNPARKSVVCEGYAKAFSLITNYLGIPSVFIVGKGNGGGHAWSAVSFDGGTTYHYLDLTWDDLGGDKVKYVWFAMPKSLFTKSHKAYTTGNTGMNWQYALPNMADNMENTYFVKYHAYATAAEVSDFASATRFLETAGAAAPGTSMMILADSSSIISMLNSAYGENQGYYPCSDYGSGKSFQFYETARYKVKNPATSFALSEADLSVDKDTTPTKSLTLTASANSDDRITFAVSNSRIVSLSKKMLDLSKGEKTVTLTFKAAGEAEITATSLMGKCVQTCKVSVTSSIASEHLYLDEENKTDADCAAFTYANGSTKKINNVSTNYKTVTLYTDLVPPKYKDAKGRSYTGKTLVGVTMEKKEPAVKDNKIAKDVDANKLASVSFSKLSDTEGKVTVTAKKPGTVYVWVITLTSKDSIQEIGYAPVELKPAPTKVIFQDTECLEGEQSNAFTAVTAKSVALNTSFDIYLNPTVVTPENSRVRETVTENTFSVTVAESWSEYIQIEKINGSLYGYRITPLKLKDTTKETKFPVTAMCGENGTSAKLNITITNAVEKMSFEKVEEGSDNTFTKSGGILKLEFSQGSGIVKRTAKLRETVQTYASGKRFDGTKIYQLPAANGFTITNAGKVTVAKGITAEQKKVGMAVVRGTQTESGADYLITANTGISDGVTAYLLVVHNGLAGKGAGYEVIEVTVGNSSIKGNEHPIWANAKDIELKKTKLNTSVEPDTYQVGKKTVTGKVVWISLQAKITGQPDFDAVNHKVKLSSDSKIASVASGGIVTAKAGGTAYIYAIETGSGKYEEFIVEVKETPLNIRMYQSADADPLKNAEEYKKATVAQGGTVDVYIKGTVGNLSKKTMQVLSGTGYEYTYNVADKDKGKVTVVPDGEHFTIRVAEDAWSQAKLAMGRTLTVKVDFICIKNGKKGTFALTVKEK